MSSQIIRFPANDIKQLGSTEPPGTRDKEHGHEPASTETIQQDIERLAMLPELQYQLVRRKEANRLGIALSVLDKEVKRHRREVNDDTRGKGTALSLPERPLWLEPVDGAQLLDDLVAAFGRYVVMPLGAADIVALWVGSHACIQSVVDHASTSDHFT